MGDVISIETRRKTMFPPIKCSKCGSENILMKFPPKGIPDIRLICEQCQTTWFYKKDDRNFRLRSIIFFLDNFSFKMDNDRNLVFDIKKMFEKGG